MAIIHLEGQEIPIDDAIAMDNQKLQDALIPFYPDAAQAEIARETKEGQIIVRMVKRAGTKGTGSDTGAQNVLNQLLKAETELNPALQLGWQLKQLELIGSLDLEVLLPLQDSIHKAVVQGEIEVKHLETTLRLLKAAPPIRASIILSGF